MECSYAPQAGPSSQLHPRLNTRADSLLLQEEFEGEAIHSLQYTTAQKYIGKKVIVVGAATAGHDVAFDLANHGVGQ